MRQKPLNQRSLALKRAVGDRLGESTSLGNLGTIARLQRSFDEAIEFHQSALALTHEIGHKEGEAQDLANLALVFRDRGDLSSALSHYRNALSTAAEIDQPEITWRIQTGLGGVYRLLGRTDDAILNLEAAVSGIEGIRGRLFEDDEKLLFTSFDKLGVYTQLILLLHQDGQETKQFEYVERARSRLMLDQLARLDVPEALFEIPVTYAGLKDFLFRTEVEARTR
jgi:tetratricopeptide (TPR) repeat protein